jgi:lipopolysaccharide/colanic/teichoic acid biosynthesis glycosyltransferase
MARDMTWSEKLAHDLEWLADRSVGLYLSLIVATAWRVLQRGAGDVAAMRRDGPA